MEGEGREEAGVETPLELLPAGEEEVSGPLEPLRKNRNVG